MLASVEGVGVEPWLSPVIIFRKIPPALSIENRFNQRPWNTMSSRVHPIFEPIRQKLEEVELTPKRVACEAQQPLRAMLSHSLTEGKRLRASLVLLSGRLFGFSEKSLIDLSAAVEILHTATLIHDDVIDNAILRRGRIALHQRYHAGATVLAGDFLLAKAVSLVEALNERRVLQLFLETTCSVCKGEIRQTLAQKHLSLGVDGYLAAIAQKTASLCSASCEMAAILAEARRHIDSSHKKLEQLPDCYSREILSSICDFVINRGC
jgi:geranylgeranyl pyrophosphate synthase